MNIQILNRDLTTYGVIGDFENATFTQAFNTRGGFVIEISSYKNAAKYLQLDKIVYIDEYKIGYIDKITTEDRGGSAGRVRIAEGYELKDRLDRYVYPAAGNVPDSYTATKVETIIKTLLKKNAGTDAAVIRQMTYLKIETDQQRGSSIDYSAWNKDLITEIFNLLAIDKMGLICGIDFDNSKITYDVRLGNDRTADETTAGGVILSVKENTALSLTDTENRLEYRNLSITAGPGSPEEREVLEVGSTTATGYDRRETGSDARDATSSNDITTAGNLKLAELKKTRTIQVEYNADGPQKLNEHFYLGDIVSSESEGDFFDAQVTKIISKYSSSKNIPGIDLVLGFDLDNVMMVKENARRMDQESIKAAGAGGGSTEHEYIDLLKSTSQAISSSGAHTVTFDDDKVVGAGAILERSGSHIKVKKTCNIRIWFECTLDDFGSDTYIIMRIYQNYSTSIATFELGPENRADSITCIAMTKIISASANDVFTASVAIGGDVNCLVKGGTACTFQAEAWE